MGPLYDIVTTLYLTHYVELVNATTGEMEPNVPHTAVAVGSVSHRGPSVSVPVAALSAPDAAYDTNRTSVGWAQVSAANNPGLYRVDFPPTGLFAEPSQNINDNENLANSGNEHFTCILTIKATGCKTQHIPFQYVANAKNRAIYLDIWGYPLNDLGHIADDSIGLALRNAFYGYQRYRANPTSWPVPSGTAGLALGPTGLKGIILEALTGAIGEIDLQEGLQWMLASVAGGREGAGTGTTTVTSPGGTPRAEYDTPGDGNRSVNSTSLTA